MESTVNNLNLNLNGLLIKTKLDLKISKKNLHNFFSLYGNMYDQIDRVAMGSILAPIPANIFLGYHKKGLEITIMEGYFILKGVLMLYLQFLNLKMMLSYFTIILIGNIVTSNSPSKLEKTEKLFFYIL